MYRVACVLVNPTKNTVAYFSLLVHFSLFRVLSIPLP